MNYEKIYNSLVFKRQQVEILTVTLPYKKEELSEVAQIEVE